MTRVIELKTTWASPEGVKQPGKHTVSDMDAVALIKAHCAEYADDFPPETAVASAPQKAVVVPPEFAGQAKGQVTAKSPVVAPPAAPITAATAGNLTQPPTWGKGVGK